MSHRRTNVCLLLCFEPGFHILSVGFARLLSTRSCIRPDRSIEPGFHTLFGGFARLLFTLHPLVDSYRPYFATPSSSLPSSSHTPNVIGRGPELRSDGLCDVMFSRRLAWIFVSLQRCLVGVRTSCRRFFLPVPPAFITHMYGTIGTGRFSHENCTVLTEAPQTKRRPA